MSNQECNKTMEERFFGPMILSCIMAWGMMESFQIYSSSECVGILKTLSRINSMAMGYTGVLNALICFTGFIAAMRVEEEKAKLKFTFVLAGLFNTDWFWKGMSYFFIFEMAIFVLLSAFFIPGLNVGTVLGTIGKIFFIAGGAILAILSISKAFSQFACGRKVR